MRAKLIAVLIIAILFVIVLLQNTQVVTYRLFFWKVSVSQIILLPLALGVGCIIGCLVCRSTKPGPRIKKLYRREP